MKRTKFRRGLLVVVLLIIAGGGAYFLKPRLLRGEPPVKTREVEVQRGRIEVTVTATGIVQPENRVEIKPPISGRVESVLANEGDRVPKGKILAWMSSTERAALLDAARA